MSPVATFHAQLASIMEVLANTAVAEICELVDSGYAVLQLEISRSRKENEVLRRKLRLMELRATRTTALRAAASSSGLLPARGRPSVSLLGEPRTRATPTDIVAVQRRLSSQEETSWCRDRSPLSDSEQETTRQTLVAGEKTTGIKVEDKDESWSQTEPDRSFRHAAEGRTTEPEASSSLIKQEAAGDEADGSVSWTSGDGSSISSQRVLNSSQRPETRANDSVTSELQHSSHMSQNPMELDPSGPSAPRVSENVSVHSGSSFGFSCGEVRSPASEQPVGFREQQQAALQRGSGGILSTFILKDGCLIQQKVKMRVTKQKEEDRMFVCNFCGKTLACLKNLKTHLRVHTGEKPFTCELCDKCFSDSSNLKRHQSVHTGEKRYVCVHCGKRFAQSGSLKAHMSVHKDCKQFKCSFCGKTFTSGGHLRRHVTVHAGEKRSAVSQ